MLVLAGLVAGGVAVVALTLLFAWPAGEGEVEGAVLTVGLVDDYAVGSVTEVGAGRFFLVRTSDEEFVALSWVDSHLRGCKVPWRPDFEFAGPNPIREGTGWFRDGCSGSTYDKLGRLVSGPSPRDLDRYVVTLLGDEVSVDTGAYVCGWAPPGASCLETTID